MCYIACHQRSKSKPNTNCLWDVLWEKCQQEERQVRDGPVWEVRWSGMKGQEEGLIRKVMGKKNQITKPKCP